MNRPLNLEPPMVSIRFGSEDSVDVAYVCDSLPSVETCRRFCASSSDENRNLIQVVNGVVVACFNGLPYETNNAIHWTQRLHPQHDDVPNLKPIGRIVPLKFIRTSRVLLSQLSRTGYRQQVKRALRARDVRLRLEILATIDWGKVDLSIDRLKTAAFQVGQSFALPASV